MRGAALALGVLLLPATAPAYTFVSRQGCPEGAGAAWGGLLLPSTWNLNDLGYPNDQGISFDDVQGALARSIAAWEAPCGSAFRSRFRGTTPATALTATSENVVSFRTRDWDELGLGISTIAVTWPETTTQCRIIGADLIFNAVNFHFRVDGAATDLEAIATHEFGHWIGLGHTSVAGATMLATYQGGTKQRSLEEDDIAGALALYPATCVPCETEASCSPGEVCAAGACRAPSCEANSECAPGAVCIDGTCRPGCRTSAECAGEEQCHNGVCRSSCSICRPCLEDSDCGDWGYFCLDLGEGPHCTERCHDDTDCDGDAVCTEVTAGNTEVGVCASPESPRKHLCTPGWQCRLLAGCPGLWNGCDAGCPKGGDACIVWDDGNHCSCTCQSDTDCGPDARCVVVDFESMCVPKVALDPCHEISCEAGYQCRKGKCVLRDPCEGVACGEGQECRAGRCEDVDLCEDVTCRPGLSCDRATGHCEDPCRGVECGTGHRCNGGACELVDPCIGVTCPLGESCAAGLCVSTCSCADGQGCGADGACLAETKPIPTPVHSDCSAAGGSATLASLLLALATLARRRR